ncbi:MAG: hypothetical protein Q4E55_03135 [Bacteroidales bacterium]|nr:hypothetical protein [Bacteroidales bacterium]
MKIFKYTFMTAIALLAMVSCKDNTPAYEWAEKPTNAQVYFNQNQKTSFSLSSTEKSFAVEFNRVKTDDAIQVPLTVTGENIENLNIPTSVSFAAGQDKANITIGYDVETFGFDKKATITFKVAQEDLTTMYGVSELTITAIIPSPWTKLGKCTIIEDYWFGDTFSADIYQNDLDENSFKIVNPFGQGDEVTLTLLHPGDTYRNVKITMDDLVGYTDFDCELHTSYDDEVFAVHPGRFTSRQDEDHYQYNYVESYQANGLPAVISLSPMYYMFNTGGWDKTQVGDLLRIVFPGVVLKDYSTDISFTGLFNAATGIVKAGVNVTLGADVNKAKLVVVPGVSDAVVDAALESEDALEISASGEYLLEMGEEPADGVYTLAVASYEGTEVQEVTTTYFRYHAEKESWMQVGTASYWYSLHFGTEEDPYEDAGLALNQDQNDLSSYRVDDCFYGTSFYFKQKDGEVVAEDFQDTGDEYGDYGPIYVSDAFSYFTPEDEEYADLQPGTYDEKTKTVTASLVYFVDAGYLAYGTENIVLDDDSEAINVASRSVRTNIMNKIKNDAKPKRSNSYMLRKYGRPTLAE